MGVLHGDEFTIFVGSTGLQVDDGQLRGVVRVAPGKRPPISTEAVHQILRGTTRGRSHCILWL